MSKHKTVYSVCGMCGVRCPIAVTVENDKARWICGNPHSPLQGALCARGAAGIALEEDDERPQQPLIRMGERGQGLWQAVSWEEAFAYVADKLTRSAQKYGPQNLLWSDRDGPFTDMHTAFMRGFGSPNICTHSVTCDINVHHASKAVTGMGRGMLMMDYAHCKHLVLQGRNLFEAMSVGECLTVAKALKSGCRLSVLDVRPTVTGAKAHDWLLLRPGTDYAFNLAVIHELLHGDGGLYQKDYVRAYCQGLEELRHFVRSCTPEWAERETGVPASALRNLVHRLAQYAPHIIWHPGWMTTRYTQSFQVSRTAFVINALLGSVGTKGGIVPIVGPDGVGKKNIQQFTSLYPAPTVARVDGVGVDFKAFDPAKGLLHRCFAAMEHGRPYPIKSYIAWRHDPLQSLPDPDALKKLFAHLDILVSVTFSWSDTAWHSDVVLPLSPYLSRESSIATKPGLKPQFFVRRRAVNPRFDTKADWEIIGGLARHLGLEKLDFASAEDIWSWQLTGTGLTIKDFDATGFVDLLDAPAYMALDSLRFPTPSGKLELHSAGWEAASGVAMLAEFVSPPLPPAGAFRLIFGRVAVHTHGHTMNNPLLHEQMPTNTACIHPSRAAELALSDGMLVNIIDAHGHSAGTVQVCLSEGMHPEALFMVHGFGHRLSCESLAYQKGAASQELLPGGLHIQDAGGGGLALQEHFVTLRPLSQKATQEAGA